MTISRTDALKSHVRFFDKNNDGEVTVTETYQGLRELGIGRIKSGFAAAVINNALGPKTNGKSGLIPFNGSSHVVVDKIKLAEHEGDSGAFKNGDFDGVAFDAMFAKYDKDNNKALSLDEIAEMQGERAHTTFGKIATKGEFGLLMQVAADGQDASGEPTISRDRLESFYKGDLFPKIAAEQKAKK